MPGPRTRGARIPADPFPQLPCMAQTHTHTHALTHTHISSPPSLPSFLPSFQLHTLLPWRNLQQSETGRQASRQDARRPRQQGNEQQTRSGKLPRRAGDTLTKHGEALFFLRAPGDSSSPSGNCRDYLMTSQLHPGVLSLFSVTFLYFILT